MPIFAPAYFIYTHKSYRNGYKKAKLSSFQSIRRQSLRSLVYQKTKFSVYQPAQAGGLTYTILIQERTYTVKTLFGFEHILAKELEELGATDIQTLNRAVSFTGDKGMLYKANLHLRTAIRILMPLHKCRVTNADELYKGVQEVNWLEYLNTSSTFIINSVVHGMEHLNNSHFVSLRAKDAIADMFMERFGKRPSIDKENPHLYIDIHIYKGDCTISLNSSGESLYKRGYRAEADKAPVNEVIAAGMVLMSGWDGQTDFVDFMCGSGTIAIEALLVAKRIAPGKFRSHFAFMQWPDFDMMLWRKIKEDALRQERSFKYEAMVSDLSPKAVDIARRNVQRAELEGDIKVEVRDFRRVRPEKGPGMLIINPPYGERIGEADEIEELYWTIGDHLKDYYPDYHAWILSSQKTALRRIDMLKPTDRFNLKNGALDCQLAHYYILPPKKKD